MDWIPLAEEKQSRYQEPHGELDERGIVRQGNAAYAAALALLMAGDPAADEWFRRAAARWRESWDAGEGRESWGRPIGALKASLLGHDDESLADVRALDARARQRRRRLRRSAATPRRSPCSPSAAGPMPDTSPSRCAAATTFRSDVADALAFIAAHDVIGYCESVESVVTSFETRGEFLEDIPVADTALVLAALARRRHIEEPLPPSPTLPS